MPGVRDRFLERLPLLLGLTLIAVGLIVGSIFLADGIRNRNTNDTVSVTGSARQGIVSDYVIWSASVSSQRDTPDAAARELARWSATVQAFLRKEGAQAGELTVQPVSTETLTNDQGEITAYKLTRSYEVRSSRVDAIATLVEKTSALLKQGIPIAANSPQYVYTKLPALRPTLVAAATKDALGRAKVLVEATGGHLGKLRSVDVGVFQVTTPNSTDVSDYGVYDTSTLRKDVIAVVNVSFALK